MNRIFRAAGFAAAAVVLSAAASIATPSQAEGPAITVAAAPAVDGSSTASVEAALDGAEATVAPEPQAEEKPGLVKSLWTAATNFVGLATAPAATTRSDKLKNLDDLVVAYAGTTTDGREQDCLAKAVYFEARGETVEGQLAVAEVVINRAGSGRYPADLCSVITQPWQFSFIRKGRFPAPDMGSDAWRKAVAVAKIAQGQLADRLPSNVLWYHADYVAPSWGKRLTRQAKIGLHIFYS
jgi:spore germination cell wall hydrolase CwlJ-like protein